MVRTADYTSRSQDDHEEYHSPEPEGHNLSDENLKNLLERWKAPIEEHRRERIHALVGELGKDPGDADPQVIFALTHDPRRSPPTGTATSRR